MCRYCNLFKKNMRIQIVAYRHLEPVLGIHSNATDGRDHGIAFSPSSGRVRKLCLLPHHRVLRLELVLFLPGLVFVVCLCLVLAMYRPGVRQQQPSLELLVFHPDGHTTVLCWILPRWARRGPTALRRRQVQGSGRRQHGVRY
jgi:hypothetical protein